MGEYGRCTLRPMELLSRPELQYTSGDALDRPKTQSYEAWAKLC